MGIAYLIYRRSMPDLSEAMPTLQVSRLLPSNTQTLVVGGHCLFNLSPFNA
ncbi:hypothetical protein [Moorena producens]|uniref:hypothetical protein n=1 Tax=Moorena producens TaxID=1155739 RepID=UPI001314236C|nr:hypothetical protein [Moorena producens]